MPQNKKIIVGLVISLLVGYSFGRFMTPTKVEIKKEVVTVEKKVVDTEELERIELERNKKLRTIITEITRPDGTKEKTTRHVEVTSTNKTTDNEKKVREELVKETKETESKLVESKHPGVTISALAGLDVTNLSTPQKPVYGGLVQKSVLGPIGVGAFGLSNGIGGMAIGLSF
jgi:hypothetical protein